jgi:hypothetical protein
MAYMEKRLSCQVGGCKPWHQRLSLSILTEQESSLAARTSSRLKKRRHPLLLGLPPLLIAAATEESVKPGSSRKRIPPDNHANKRLTKKNPGDRNRLKEDKRLCNQAD